MKISFMTWSCPEWTVPQILQAAKKYGYHGVEPRAQANHKHGVETDATPAQRADIRRQFADAGIEISCIATSIRYSSSDPAERAEQVELTKRFADLAADLGCPYLRVFGGPIPEGVAKEDCKRYVADALRQTGEYARDRGVVVCIETHDSFSLAKDNADTVRMADHPNVQTLWDIAHPITHGETMDEAFGYIKDTVRHCHIHDLAKDTHELVFIGEGIVDHARAVQLLDSIDFPGHLSGEWISAWDPDVILPHWAEKFNEYLSAARR